ncbi:uncharacterized protein BDZ99DRAFT_479866 [Mytilinidion resinicola]|uniref:G domain-containing protein n=1 Tax=Mytilinidion resinicola TaxID=574789 RepID=A0A6A6YCK6_9PEZI|nr:uncharacterized protein BDZ99DRAFT_479866 [Mytilinidion resinicola]KAF2805835.1 hypothetical protein BDZ99DRAFT_479866 [Mytilinidion resinicola]
MFRQQERRRRLPRPYRGPPGNQRPRERSPSQESSSREPEYSRPNGLNQRHRTPERVVIAVCGMTGSGKSSFIQKVSGEQMKVGDGLKSCTTEVQEVSCRVGRHEITLVDTPGFGDDTRNDVDVLEEIVR